MWDAGIRGKTWQIIGDICSKSRSKVRVDNTTSEFFEINQGVAQGSPLSPLLFIIFVNSLLKKLREAEIGIEVDEMFCGGLMYADDFTGVCDSESQLEKMVKAVGEWTNKWRLQANVKKSAIMMIKPFGGPEKMKKPKIRWCNGEFLDVVEEYEYLGVIISASATRDKHICHARDKTRRKIWSLHDIWSDKDLSTETKLKILCSAVIPCLLYAAEAWYAHDGNYKKLRSALMSATRLILSQKNSVQRHAI